MNSKSKVPLILCKVIRKELLDILSIRHYNTCTTINGAFDRLRSVPYAD